MSRTIRRKNDLDKAGRWSSERSYTHEPDEEHAKLHGGWKAWRKWDWRTSKYTDEVLWYFSNVTFSGRKYIPKKGKAFRKGWWEYHNDTIRCFSGMKGPGHFITSIQRQYRREAAREIQKFIVNDEYEPMILSKPKREWWD